MKRISIYIRAKEISPSGYYRILQYTDKLHGDFIIHNILPPVYYKYYLSHRNIFVFSRFLSLFTYILMYVRCIYFLIYDILNHIDVVIISRGLLPRILLYPIPALLGKLRRLVGTIIWDFDDDILLSKEISEKEYLFWSQNSDKIFVTHDYLAHKVSSEFCEKIVIIPTTDGDFSNIDIAYAMALREKDFSEAIVLVWTGSAVNLAHVIPIITSLDYCAEEIMKRYHKKLILKICSSAPLISVTKYLIIDNINWNRLLAVDILIKSHIGIMPLLPSEYSLGKGGFKLIQYMAAGLPIVGSGVGFNKEIIQKEFGQIIELIDDSEAWLRALITFIDNFEDYRQAALKSLDEWNKRYSFERNLDVWSQQLGLSHK